MQLLNARWARALLTCCINSVSVPLPSVFFSAKCHWAVSGSWNWKKLFFKKSFLKSVLAQNSLPEAILSTGLDDKEWEKSSTSHEWPFIHICIKTNISRAELFCLESFSMTPDKISKKVLFEFWHFHAFALWLIHNIYWAPASFFTAKREDSHLVNLQLISFICANSNSSRSNPVNLSHRCHSIVYKGKRALQFSKKLIFVHHHGSILELHPSKSSLKSCLSLWAVTILAFLFCFINL